MRLTALLLAAVPATALAHEADLSVDPYAVAAAAALALAAMVYATAWRRGAIARRRDALAFAAGWTTLALAVLPPLEAAPSFALHMIQHELMMLLAPPLLILGRPFAALAALAPPSVVHVAALPLRTPPLAAWILHAAALWMWHVPRLFDAAVASDRVHALQHFAFLGSALLFWWAVFRRVRRGMAVLYILTTMMHMGALAALLTFAPAPLYDGTALTDQQLGGLIMWVPAGFVMLVAGLLAFDRLLEERT